MDSKRVTFTRGEWRRFCKDLKELLDFLGVDSDLVFDFSGGDRISDVVWWEFWNTVTLKNG